MLVSPHYRDSQSTRVHVANPRVEVPLSLCGIWMRGPTWRKVVLEDEVKVWKARLCEACEARDRS